MDRLSAALEYAARGWQVIPLHTPRADGTCSCLRTCNNVGKHPRTHNGLHDATTDAATIRQWWRMWPDANVGIRTGAVSNLVVLDVDPKSGGAETLADWEDEHGRLPETPEDLTGGGGRHLLFRHPGGIVRNQVGKLGPGLDLRGDGGYIVAPPSLHASGRFYQWELSSDPATTPLADPPAWLCAPATETTGGAPSDNEGMISSGNRNAALTSLAGSMRRRGMPATAILAALRVVNAERCDPPLTEAEVEKIAASVGRYLPAFSLDENGGRGDSIELAFEKLIQIDTQPPMYRLTLNGAVLLLELEDLLTFRRFKHQVVAALRFVPRIPWVKGKSPGQVWDEILNGWLDHVEIEAAPETASESGLIESAIAEWIYTSRTAEEKECLLRGLRWISEEGTIYFSLKNLRLALRNQFDKLPQQHHLYVLLRKLGVEGPKPVRIGTQVAKCWYLSRANDAQDQDANDGRACNRCRGL